MKIDTLCCMKIDTLCCMKIDTLCYEIDTRYFTLPDFFNISVKYDDL